MHDIMQSVLGKGNYPAHQGIKATIHVPEYSMNVGSGSYISGHKTGQVLVQLDKPTYTTRTVPFQKLSTDYQP